MEIIEDFSGSTNDPSIIIKGKRTKRRQRPLSPVGKAAVTSSSSSGGGGVGEGEDGDVLEYVYSLIPTSTTTCASDISTTTSTDQEEEEDNDQDIANCLILLAQGGESSGGARKQVDQIKMEKFSSRRFNEMVTSTTGGKVGFFVYECKTCNRTFPSFQALGGHRASHKRPKVAMEEKKTVILIPPPPTTTTTTNIDRHHHEEEEVYEGAGEEEQREINRLSPPLSVQSTNKCLERNSNNNKGKIHECSMCGAEFSSGQALGGHMRRHRNPMTTKVSMNVETSPSSTTHDDDDDESSHDVKKPRNIFPLDLNLPAPVEDEHHRELKFQQHHLVFSAPALVDCHY